MKTDILNTTQNPDELRRLAQDLLDKQTQRIHTLENDNAAIQAEKTALEQHIRGQEVMMLAATTAYEQRIRELEEALKLAQSGASAVSERLPASQKPLADEDAASDEADITRQLSDLLPPKEKTGKKPVRQLLPAHLPREETVLAPETGSGDGYPCPGCGAAMRHIRDEVNEVLEYVPAHFVVKRTVRPQYGCPCCDTVHSAALPAAIIDKGLPGPGLLTQVVIAKVLDHLPLQRQQKIYAREGVQLPVSTLADWFGQTAAVLSPLAAALKRDLLSNRCCRQTRRRCRSWTHRRVKRKRAGCGRTSVQQAVPAISWCTTAGRDVGENMPGRCWPAGQESWWLTGMPVTAGCSATVRKERPRWHRVSVKRGVWRTCAESSWTCTG